MVHFNAILPIFGWCRSHEMKLYSWLKEKVPWKARPAGKWKTLVGRMGETAGLRNEKHRLPVCSLKQSLCYTLSKSKRLSLRAGVCICNPSTWGQWEEGWHTYEAILIFTVSFKLVKATYWELIKNLWVRGILRLRPEGEKTPSLLRSQSGLAGGWASIQGSSGYATIYVAISVGPLYDLLCH